MNMFRRGTGRFGLALLVALALSGVVAGVAQAGEWQIEGLTFEKRGLAKESVKGSGGGPIGFELPKSGVKISCSSQTMTGSIVKGGTGLASITLGECQTTLEEKPVEGCEVAPIAMKLASGLVESGEGVMYNELLPETEKGSFATVEAGEECALFESLKLTGTAAGSGTTTQSMTKSFSYSRQASEDTETGLVSGTEPAYMFGTVPMQLAGANSGKSFGPLFGFFDANPEEPDLGSVKVGSSTTLTITFHYLGSLLSRELSDVVQTKSGDFSKVSASDTCFGKLIFPGQDCAVVVKFEPKATGTRTGTLTLEEIGIKGRSMAVPLKGTGT
jgi:hypothetical protein